MYKFFVNFADILRIVWFFAWRAAAIGAAFLAVMYLASWSWWS